MARPLFRVCRSIHARLDGEGARLVGGRWNSPGTAVVYMAETVSLALLENLVHMSREDFPTGYVLVPAILPDGMQVLQEEDIIDEFGPLERNRLGDLWIEKCSSAVLAVRSTVVPFERNFLLNPQHPEFAGITVEPATPFSFDERLFGHRR
jgi:RES domain-containing protein